MSISQLGDELPLINRFQVFIGQEIKGNFSKVYGLESEIEVETYQEGGNNGSAIFFPKSQGIQRLVLERGIMKADPMTTWYLQVKTGVITKLQGVIALLDMKGKMSRAWSVLDAYPVKYIGPSLDALSNEVAVTRIEFLHSGIEEISV